jgi:branched-chain amino acid transport system permease protein
MKVNRKNIPAIIAILFSLLIPLIIQDPYILHLIIMSIIWGIVAINWNLTLGYGGMFHIAQMSFFAVGGYMSGIFTNLLGINPYFGAIIGGIFASLVSLLIGVPSLRVKGVYLILLTFSFHFALKELTDHFRDFTGGSMGMIIQPLQFNGQSLNTIQYYYVILALFIVTIIVNWAVIRSNIGKALMAIRDSEVLAKASGINPYKYKLITFVLSAFITGITGSFYASYLEVIGTEIFSFHLIVNVMSMVIIGGIGTLMGPLAGSVIVTLFMEIFRKMDTLRPILVGVVTILVLLFAPQGLVQQVKLLWKKYVSKSFNEVLAKGVIDHE